jgi:hypothetical protein
LEATYPLFGAVDVKETENGYSAKNKRISGLIDDGLILFLRISAAGFVENSLDNNVHREANQG